MRALGIIALVISTARSRERRAHESLRPPHLVGLNNAGISGRTDDDAKHPTTLDLDVLRTVLDTNVFGVVRVTNAMLPLLRRVDALRIVNVSSNMGSLTLQRRARARPGRADSASGIRGIRERAMLMGAQLTLGAGRAGGTAVELRIPAKAP